MSKADKKRQKQGQMTFPELKNKYAKTVKEMDRLRSATVGPLEDTIRGLNSEIESKDTVIKGLRASMTAADKRFESMFKDTQASSVRTLNEVEASHREKTNMDALQITSLNTHVGSLETELGELGSRVTEMDRIKTESDEMVVVMEVARQHLVKTNVKLALLTDKGTPPGWFGKAYSRSLGNKNRIMDLAHRLFKWASSSDGSASGVPEDVETRMVEIFRSWISGKNVDGSSRDKTFSVSDLYNYLREEFTEMNGAFPHIAYIERSLLDMWRKGDFGSPEQDDFPLVAPSGGDMVFFPRRGFMGPAKVKVLLDTLSTE